jgi:hypothetical protein
MLRYNPRKMENLTVESDSELPLKDVAGNSLELSIEIVPGGAEQFGVEQAVVLYDAAEKRSETMSDDNTGSFLLRNVF